MGLYITLRNERVPLRERNYRSFIMKSLFRFLGIIALAAVIGFTMTACDDATGGGSDAINPLYYGTWVKSPESITITADTIKWQKSNSGDSNGFVQYTNVKWTKAKNNDPSLKTNYPNGYTFTGTRSVQNYSGLYFGFVALSADGQSLCLLEDNIHNLITRTGFAKQP
jgi:hypothetical protein